MQGDRGLEVGEKVNVKLISANPRNGFIETGGTPEYPTWDEFSEAKAKDETRRCMRHAVDVLLTLPDSYFTADQTKKAHARMEKGSFKALHARMFPDKAMRRKGFEKMQAEIQAEALNRSIAE